MNGLYAQAQLQQQAINAIQNYSTIEKIKPHVVKLNPPKVYKSKLDSAPKSSFPNINYPWNNSAPIVDPTVTHPPSSREATVGTIQPQNIHSTSSTTITSNTSTSSSNTSNTSILSDFSNYSTYIIIGGVALLIFFFFSGSSSNKQKYVQIDVPE